MGSVGLGLPQMDFGKVISTDETNPQAWDCSFIGTKRLVFALLHTQHLRRNTLRGL
jgi:hypothetical protein